MIESALTVAPQIFSPHVAAEVARRPELLEPQTRELTLLFADLRGFTSLSAELPPRIAYHLLGDVLEALTEAVMGHDGVLIDYYGDGLSALWNAPLDHPEHADAACRAGLQMLAELPAVSDHWNKWLPHPLALRIGIHTGAAQVGNAGTRRRFKYGPRGLSVNLASRIESAAKFLDVPLLATDAVRQRLGPEFFTLRICTAKLPGIAEPHDVFAVYRATHAAAVRDRLNRYAEALHRFEAGDLADAERLLDDLADEPDFAPAGFLSDHTTALLRGRLGRRATDALGEGPDAIIEILAK